MKKLISLCLVTVLVLTLSSCKDLEYLKENDWIVRDDGDVFDEKISELVDAANKKDTEAIKALFSESSIEASGNLDNSIEDFLTLLDSSEVIHVFDGLVYSEQYRDSGKWRNKFESDFELIANGQKYYAVMTYIPTDDFDSKNIGIKLLRVIREGDDKYLSPEYLKEGVYDGMGLFVPEEYFSGAENVM